MQRALLTGATGFIGGHLSQGLIDHGWEVHALIRHESRAKSLNNGVHCHFIDAKNLSKVVDEVAPDVTFHLAARFDLESGDEASEALVSDNIAFGVRLLDALTPTPCRRFINTGSFWEFGENGMTGPNTLYAVTKVAFRSFLDWYVTRFNFSAASLILFEVYGHSDRRKKLIPILLDAAARSDRVALTPGYQLLDMVHVEDVVSAYQKAAQILPPPGSTPAVWSVSSGRRLTVRELTTIVSIVADRPLAIDWGARDYPKHQIMKPTSAIPLLPDWRPGISIECGIKRLLAEKRGN